jgi:hypothetical protein
MSEHQYYEFQAVDRPLTAREIEELERVSSRAEITSTSFINEYNYGDFRGDPHKLVAKYFDAFVYHANWGTHRFIVRVPIATLPLAEAKPYAADRTLKITKPRSYLILDFESNDESGDWEYQSIDWMKKLLPLRADLMRCDLRPLYIGWLAAVVTGSVKDEAREPPVPPGMKNLSASQRALATFLFVDDKLLKVAAAGSGTAEPVAEPSAADWKKWISALPVTAKNESLLRVVNGEGPQLAAELNTKFLAARRRARGKPPTSPSQSGRTAGELFSAAGYDAD